jgi:hypothetical protein
VDVGVGVGVGVGVDVGVGVGVGVAPLDGIISIPLDFALSTTVLYWIVICPLLLAVAVNCWIFALFALPYQALNCPVKA